MFWLLNYIVDMEFLMKIKIGMHAFVGWIQRLTACASHISDVLNEESNFPLMSTQVRVEDWKKNQAYNSILIQMYFILEFLFSYTSNKQPEKQVCNNIIK